LYSAIKSGDTEALDRIVQWQLVLPLPCNFGINVNFREKTNITVQAFPWRISGETVFVLMNNYQLLSAVIVDFHCNMMSLVAMIDFVVWCWPSLKCDLKKIRIMRSLYCGFRYSVSSKIAVTWTAFVTMPHRQRSNKRNLLLFSRSIGFTRRQ